MQRHTHAALEGPGTRVAARMPLRFPIHQLGRFRQFFRVLFCAWAENGKILSVHLHWIHLYFRGEVIERAHRHVALLWSIRRAPGADRTCVRKYSSEVCLAIREV